MNKKEIIKRLKEVKTKMIATKKNDYEEYLKLRDERLKLESELARLKKQYYAEIEEAAKIKIRRGNDHKKFIYGGLCVKYFGYLDEKELEQKLQTIANHKVSDIDINTKDDDVVEYLKNVEV
ncbi:MAG: hypothetical protein ACYCSW_09530 [bacterium]